MITRPIKSYLFKRRFVLLATYSNKHSGGNEILDEHSHSFGFQTVLPSEKREKVQNVFSAVAKKYDLMNDIMSFGIHRFWKDYFIQTLSPTEGISILDVAGGTGDIAFRCLKASSNNCSLKELNSTDSQKKSHVTILDLNDKMLSVCRNKAKQLGIENQLTFIHGNAEMLPFPDNSFDAYTIAFGIRNVVHINKALSEACRVLLPGGRFMCLEFSKCRYPLSSLYEWYSKEIIPVMGQTIAGEWQSYQYLIESIQKFPNQEDFLSMIKEAGMRNATYENISGGITAFHSAYKF